MLLRFIKPEMIAKAESLHTLNSDRAIQKPRGKLTIGKDAREYLEKCKEDGLLTSDDRTVFYDSVRKTCGKFILKTMNPDYNCA